MHLRVINPNTTASMTEKIGVAARAVASDGVTVDAVNPVDGPASIEGYFDEAYSVPGLLDEIAAAPGSVNGFVLACFDDTGLDAARCATDRPVVGIGEAAFHTASLIAVRFSVVTTLSRSLSAIEHNLHRYGLSARCARVRASEVPVLELEDPRSDARARISAEIATAMREDGCDAIVLGCAGMADLAAALSEEHGLPVLDGVACAVATVESLVRLGLRTSRSGAYAPPRAKAYAGKLASVGARLSGVDA